MNQYSLLTPQEKEELAYAIANNYVGVFSDTENLTDEFLSHRLSTGRVVSGKYRWDSDEGEFIYLEIEEEEEA